MNKRHKYPPPLRIRGHLRTRKDASSSTQQLVMIGLVVIARYITNMIIPERIFSVEDQTLYCLTQLLPPRHHNWSLLAHFGDFLMTTSIGTLVNLVRFKYQSLYQGSIWHKLWYLNHTYLDSLRNVVPSCSQILVT